MRLDEKMATVGLAVGSLAYKATAIAVGLIKISVPMNCWVIKVPRWVCKRPSVVTDVEVHKVVVAKARK